MPCKEKNGFPSWIHDNLTRIEMMKMKMKMKMMMMMMMMMMMIMMVVPKHFDRTANLKASVILLSRKKQQAMTQMTQAIRIKKGSHTLLACLLVGIAFVRHGRSFA